MRNRYYLLTLLVLLIGGIVFSKPLLAQQYGQMKDTFNKYKIEFPLAWKAVKSPHSKDLIKAEFEKNKETGLQVRIYKTKSNFKNFVDWYVGNYTKQMTQHYHQSTLTVLKKQFSKPPSPRWFYVSFDFTQKPGYRYYVIQYVFPRQNEMFVLQAGCPYAERHSFESTVLRMAKSLTFLK